jgi:ubiquinone/menaquinone biosynthesis C-methylase UbiE
MESYLYEDLYNLEEHHWWHRNKRELVLKLLGRYLPKNKVKLVDIGCGTGKNVETFEILGESWGLDTSEEAIAYCKKRGLSHIRKGTAENTRLPASSFDAVTILDVLEHTDDKQTVREAFRILKPGGIVILTVPAYRWYWSRWDEVLHHKRRYGKRDVEQLVTGAKFIIRKISFVYGFLVLPGYIIRTVKQTLQLKSYGSDFQLSFPFLNTILLAVCRIESWVIRWGYMPFGTSLICVARKRNGYGLTHGRKKDD